MKKNADFSLEGLLDPEAKAGKVAPKEKGNYKSVCYSIPPKTADKIRQIAAWDRKKIGAVVTEAFEQYAASWIPSTQKPPKF